MAWVSSGWEFFQWGDAQLDTQGGGYNVTIMGSNSFNICSGRCLVRRWF